MSFVPSRSYAEIAATPFPQISPNSNDNLRVVEHFPQLPGKITDTIVTTTLLVKHAHNLLNYYHMNY